MIPPTPESRAQGIVNYWWIGAYERGLDRLVTLITTALREATKQKELDDAAHILTAAPDGCCCEPCLSAQKLMREAEAAGLEQMADKFHETGWTRTLSYEDAAQLCRAQAKGGGT